MFKIYRKNKKSSGISNLHRQDPSSKIQEPTDTVNLLEFGIFSEHKKC